MFKISGNFLSLIILFFLGYTHFLGGPYGLAKFFFILILIGTFGFYFFMYGIALFAKKMLGRSINFGHKQNTPKDNETIKVDAKIIE